jgi:hypothetical protein
MIRPPNTNEAATFSLGSSHTEKMRYCVQKHLASVLSTTRFPEAVVPAVPKAAVLMLNSSANFAEFFAELRAIGTPNCPLYSADNIRTPALTIRLLGGYLLLDVSNSLGQFTPLRDSDDQKLAVSGMPRRLLFLTR